MLDNTTEIFVFNEMKKIMNFHYEIRYRYANNLKLDIFDVPGDFHEAKFPMHSNYFKYDILGPIYKVV